MKTKAIAVLLAAVLTAGSLVPVPAMAAEEALEEEAVTAETAAEAEIADGWITTCDVYCDPQGTFIFDLEKYEPTDNAIIYFARNDHNSSLIQGTITNGMIVWDTLQPGWVYEYAIWSGPSDLAENTAKLSEDQIPESAWISVSVDEDHKISIVSSRIPINIRPNME